MVVEERGSDDIGSGLLTIKEVAGLLHAHPSSVRRWAKEGLIKCYRVGMRGDRRFKAEHVDEFIQAGAQYYREGNGNGNGNGNGDTSSNGTGNGNGEGADVQ